MALDEIDLPVSAILSTLGVSSLRAIFYKGAALDTLKTVEELKNLVADNGLNATYCPGTTNEQRITNLLNTRNLKYFKGYNHALLRCNPLEIDFWFQNNTAATVNIISSMSWSISKNQSWITISKTSGSGNSTFSINVTNNGTSNYRTGTVTVTGGGVTVTIRVNQEAMLV